MKATAFVGDDPVKRRLALDAAIKDRPEGTLNRFDLSDPDQLTPALQSLGEAGFLNQHRTIVWHEAQHLKKPERLKALTLDRFLAGGDATLLVEAHVEAPRKGKISFNSLAWVLHDAQSVETQTFPLPVPWKEEECLKWITDLAEQLGFKLGLQLAKQLKQMVGFEPTKIFNELRFLAAMKAADVSFSLSSSTLDRWVKADHADFSGIIDSILHRRKAEAFRLINQLGAAELTWPVILLRLQSESWTALQYISSRGHSQDHTAKGLRTSPGKVWAMSNKFQGISLERASALHQILIQLSASAAEETAALMRPNLRLLGAVGGLICSS